MQYLKISILWFNSASDSNTLYGFNASFNSLVLVKSLGFGSATLIADVMPNVRRFFSSLDDAFEFELLPCDDHILTRIYLF